MFGVVNGAVRPDAMSQWTWATSRCQLPTLRLAMEAGQRATGPRS
jgi:hypothetical protein